MEWELMIWVDGREDEGGYRGRNRILRENWE
jgi:hypothetical protein